MDQRNLMATRPQQKITFGEMREMGIRDVIVFYSDQAA